MTEPRKRTDAEVWQALEKVAAELKDLERIDALSDEELDRELRAAGIDPDEAMELGPAFLVRPPRRAPGTPPQARTGRRQAARSARKVQWVAWAALAAAVVLVVGWLASRPDNVASPRPDDRTPVTDGLATKPQAAAKLRDEAFGACAAGLRGACEEKLNAARALDPAGEQYAKVLAARRSVHDAAQVDAGH